MKNTPGVSPVWPFWDRSMRDLLEGPNDLKAVLSLSGLDWLRCLQFDRLEPADRSVTSEQLEELV